MCSSDLTNVNPQTPFNDASDETTQVVAADVNGDSRMDIIACNRGSKTKIYISPSSGSFPGAFTTSKLPVAYESYGVAVADVDGDGFPDVVLANSGEHNQIFINPGDGVFDSVEPTKLGSEIVADDSRAVAIGDVDKDSKMDVVIGNVGTENKLYKLGDQAPLAQQGVGTSASTAAEFGEFANSDSLQISDRKSVV